MKLIYTLLIILKCSIAFGSNFDEDFSYGSAMRENPEYGDYLAVVGGLRWRMEQIENEIKAKCDNHECKLITFREHVKGWTFHATVGNGPGSGSAYDHGSRGAINIYNGSDVSNDVIANIGIAYRNITCDRTPLVSESLMRAYVTLNSDLITEDSRIKEELNPAEIVLLKVFATIIKASGQGGSCGGHGGRY